MLITLDAITINIFSSSIFIKVLIQHLHKAANTVCGGAPAHVALLVNLRSCEDRRRPHPQGSGGSLWEQLEEDINLGHMRRPKGLSKEGLRAKGGEEEGRERGGGRTGGSSSSFFHSRYFMCVQSESGCNTAATFTF